MSAAAILSHLRRLRVAERGDNASGAQTERRGEAGLSPRSGMS